MSLLHSLALKLPAKRLGVAHFNHRTRGPENEKDSQLVRQAAEKLGISFYLGSRAQIGPASEGELRTQRRKFLEGVADKHAFDHICTAHHANDQLETVLMRLMRGTDWKGMGAIRFRAGKWVRPILGVSREAVEKYAKRHSIEFRTDGSNYQMKHLRNALRHGVAQEFLQIAENSGMSRKAVLENVANWCLRAQEVGDFLESYSQGLLEELVVETRFWARIDHKGWSEIDPAVQPFVLNLLAQRYLGQTVCRQQLKLWRKNLNKKQKRFDLKAGIHIRVSCGYWYLMLDAAEPVSAAEVGSRPGVFRFPEIEAEVEIVPGAQPYEVRYFRAGDRLEKSGRKLKEIFQRTRVPAPERKLIPVVARPASSEVLWYMGAQGTRFAEDLLPGIVADGRCAFPFTGSGQAN